MQGDVLQSIGSVLTARSDTFVIRTYGEVLNPLDSTAAPISRAWCEAVVQRLPDYRCHEFGQCHDFFINNRQSAVWASI